MYLVWQQGQVVYQFQLSNANIACIDLSVSMPAESVNETDHLEDAWKHELVDESSAPLLTKDDNVNPQNHVSGKKLVWIAALPALVAVFALYRAVTALRAPIVVAAPKMTTNTFVPSKYEVVPGIFMQSDCELDVQFTSGS